MRRRDLPPAAGTRTRTTVAPSLGPVLAAVLSSAPPAATGAGNGRSQVPDLDRIRLRMPALPKRVWLEGRLGGAYLPAAVTDLSANASTIYGTLAWSFSFARWLAAHGTHTVAGYRARNVVLQGSEHDLGLAVTVLDGAVGQRPARGFLDLTGSVHVIKRSWVDGRLFKLGGLWDSVAGIGLAFEHDLPRRVRLGWRIDGRWVWVFTSTQRQVRAVVRVEAEPRRGHVLGAIVTGTLVHRDARQFGRRLPRVGPVGQAELRYAYFGRRGVGPVVRLRYSTGFRSSEAPVYEVRAETLTTHYADLWFGVAGSF